MIIPETRRAHYIRYLLFLLSADEAGILSLSDWRLIVLLITVKYSHKTVKMAVCALMFFTYMPENQIFEKIMFIQTIFFIIFTCPNPVVLVPGFA
jgi:hypothetical protein